MKKVFVTLFTKCKGLGITKDVGQIPQVMASRYGYDSYLVTYDNGEDYEEWRKKYAANIKITFIKKSVLKNEFVDEIRFIIKNARKIDVLHMFHMEVQHLICLWIYKILNPKGISYLRLDIDYPALEGHAELAQWKKKIIRFLHKGTDIVSAESAVTCYMYEELFGIKPICVPVGFVDIDQYGNTDNTSDKNDTFNNEISRSLFGCKKKIIMTAGRLGTQQKATEVLLEAFAKTHNSDDWKLILAGPISDEFSDYLKSFKSYHLDMMERIIFTGNITDKLELYKYMEMSSIFALPSRWGSAEIVLVEALSRGCYLIMSDRIPPYKEYTNNGSFGIQAPVDNTEEWADAIDTAIIHIEQNGFDVKSAASYGKDNFNWVNILKSLDDEIKITNKRSRLK